MSSQGPPPGGYSQQLANALAVPQTTISGAAQLLYNGASLDLANANIQGAALAQLARTALGSSPLLANPNHRGVLCTLNIPASGAPVAPSAAAGLQLGIYGVDPLGGGLYQLNPVPPKVVAAGLYGYALYPSPPPAALPPGLQQVTPGILPRTWAIQVAAGDATPIAYSVSFALVV